MACEGSGELLFYEARVWELLPAGELCRDASPCANGRKLYPGSCQCSCPIGFVGPFCDRLAPHLVIDFVLFNKTKSDWVVSRSGRLPRAPTSRLALGFCMGSYRCVGTVLFGLVLRCCTGAGAGVVYWGWYNRVVRGRCTDAVSVYWAQRGGDRGGPAAVPVLLQHLPRARALHPLHPRRVRLRRGAVQPGPLPTIMLRAQDRHDAVQDQHDDCGRCHD
eukprot:3333412-Rhodomonas_salina.2